MMSRSVLLRGIRKHTFRVVALALVECGHRWRHLYCPTEEQQAQGTGPPLVIMLPVTPTLTRWSLSMGLGFRVR
jgi:hypothetical protein